MSDIGRWLDQHELGKYTEVFVEHEIDFDVLEEITLDELKDLGIPLGARKRILKAVATLCEERGSFADDLSESESDRPTTGEAERRQLTVMFCDLVGSTALSESMDPEDYRDLLSAYQMTATGAIREHDGYIARYMGDGLLVYFGYPVAQENDPERAARAGLAVIDAVTDSESAVPLEVRVGIATGPVVVGDIIGEGVSEETAVLGETPNVAARLQGAAAPNTVLLSPATHQLLRGRMEMEALKPVELKGLSQPLVPYRAVRPRSLSEVSESRVDSTPLVGRDVEVAFLERAWKHARSSEGQAVLLSGEPGVGKSRLLRAFQEGVDEASRTRVQWYCSSYFQTTAHYPAIEQLKRSLSGDSLETLESLVRELELDINVLIPPLALLLSIPLSDRYPAPDWSPDELKRRLIRAQVELLRAAATRAPVLFVIEDLHWADPTTLGVLGEMIAAIRDQRVLVLMTARPEFSPPWVHQAHATTQRLSNLSRNETMELVRGIAAEHGLSTALLGQIVERTDGVPLFVEELTRGLLESSGEAVVPASLQDSLMARLDRLGSTKEVAQIASVIGRSFSHEALTQLADRPRDAIEQALGRLVDSGLVHRRTGSEYEFKHALIRDTAYGSMLRQTRRDIHGRLARHLETSKTTRRQPELLGRHYAAADMHADASRWWARAGEDALARSAPAEAVASLESALASLAQLPDSEDRERVAVELRVKLGHATRWLYGEGSEATIKIYEHALSAASELKDARVSIWPLRALVMSLPARSPTGVLSRARQLEALAKEFDDHESELIAAGAIVAHNYLSGLFGSAVDLALTWLPRAEGWDSPSDMVVFAARVKIRRQYAMACDALGQRAAAAATMAVARAEAEATGQAAMLVNALVYSAKLMTWQRRFDDALLHAERALQIAEQHQLPMWIAGSKVFLGRSLAACDDVDEGLRLMAEGIGSWHSPSWFSEWRTHHAQALLESGRIDQAREVITEAESYIESVGAVHYAAECHRVKGLIAYESNAPSGDVDFALTTALELSRAQGARTFELHAALDLAKRSQRYGTLDAARSLLTPILLDFDQESAFPALHEARSLLDELTTAETLTKPE